MIYYIVDDDSDDQHFLIEAITENDSTARCYTAYDGQEAIASLRDGTVPLPDAIFLDLNMPGLSGKQCLAEIKRQPSLQQIPIIIYSTSSDKNDIRETMKMGASCFLTKKNSFRELREDLLPITRGIHPEKALA